MPNTMTGPLAGFVDIIIFNLSNDRCGVSRGHRERRHVLRDNRARADDRAVPDSYAGQDYRIETDPNIASDTDRFGRSATRHSASPSERCGLELRAALFRIERDAVGVHEHHIP